MARKRKEDEPKPGAPAYMNTYGDMMTLLLVFFVLLFSMSTIDIAKYKDFISAFDGGSGVLDGDASVAAQIQLGNGMNQHPEINNIDLDSPNEDIESQYKSKQLEEMTSDIKSYLEDNNLTDKVDVSNNGKYISLKFDDILLFDTAKADLKPDAISVLYKIGVLLDEYLENPAFHLAFEGHTDNLPISTSQFPSNWELSASRAIAVAKFYIDEMDFNPEQISAEGFGQYVHIAPNDTAEGRAANRRVEVKILTEP